VRARASVIASSSFRSPVLLAPSGQRAGLIASIYVVAYLALGVPAILAGVALTRFSLHATTYG
jgi:hypothetical protein